MRKMSQFYLDQVLSKILHSGRTESGFLSSIAIKRE